MPIGLTPKQERFIEEFLVDLNATQAAIRAGYSKKTAYDTGFKNLRKPEIQKAIDERRAAITAEVDITIKGTLIELQQTLDRCLEAQEVTDGDGNPTGVFTFNASGALKAIELKGRYLGMWDGTSRKDPAPVIDIGPITNRNPELAEAIEMFRRPPQE